jgi:hypothetical protein
LELALKAVALVHTPLAKVEEAPLQQRLHDVAKKVHIMQALLDYIRCTQSACLNMFYFCKNKLQEYTMLKP